MDARVRYTKMVIKEQFIHLLKETSLDKITVTKICDCAEINRATFYKYYNNPADLLYKIEKELLDGLEEKTNHGKDMSLPEIFRVILEDIKKNGYIYETLFSKNSDAEFRKKVFEIAYRGHFRIIQEHFPEMPLVQQEYLYYFMAEGCNGIVKQWMRRGMSDSIDNLIEMAQAMFDIVNEYMPAEIEKKRRDNAENINSGDN